jgi:hypothetical protein
LHLPKRPPVILGSGSESGRQRGPILRCTPRPNRWQYPLRTPHDRGVRRQRRSGGSAHSTDQLRNAPTLSPLVRLTRSRFLLTQARAHSAGAPWGTPDRVASKRGPGGCGAGPKTARKCFFLLVCADFSQKLQRNAHWVHFRRHRSFRISNVVSGDSRGWNSWLSRGFARILARMWGVRLMSLYRGTSPIRNLPPLQVYLAYKKTPAP